MNDDTTTPAVDDPDRTQLRSAALQADVIRVAGQVARTQDSLAAALRRIASQNPDEGRLRAATRAAENHAARTRRLASALRNGRPAGDDTPA